MASKYQQGPAVSRTLAKADQVVQRADKLALDRKDKAAYYAATAAEVAETRAKIKRLVQREEETTVALDTMLEQLQVPFEDEPTTANPVVERAESVANSIMRRMDDQNAGTQLVQHAQAHQRIWRTFQVDRVPMTQDEDLQSTLRCQVEELKVDVIRLQGQAAEEESRARKLAEENASLKEQVQSLTGSLGKARVARDDGERRITELEQEADEIRKQIAKFDGNAELEEKIEKLQETNSDLEKKVARLQDGFNDVNNRRDAQLQEATNEAAAARTAEQDLRFEAEQLSEGLKFANEEIETLTREVQGLQVDKTNAGRRVERLEEQLSAAEADSRTLAENCAASERHGCQLEAEKLHAETNLSSVASMLLTSELGWMAPVVSRLYELSLRQSEPSRLDWDPLVVGDGKVEEWTATEAMLRAVGCKDKPARLVEVLATVNVRSREAQESIQDWVLTAYLEALSGLLVAGKLSVFEKAAVFQAMMVGSWVWGTADAQIKPYSGQDLDFLHGLTIDQSFASFEGTVMVSSHITLLLVPGEADGVLVVESGRIRLLPQEVLSCEGGVLRLPSVQGTVCEFELTAQQEVELCGALEGIF